MSARGRARVYPYELVRANGPSSGAPFPGRFVYDVFMGLLVASISGLMIWNFIWTANLQDKATLLMEQTANLTTKSDTLMMDLTAKMDDINALQSNVTSLDAEDASLQAKDMVLMSNITTITMEINNATFLLPKAFAHIRTRATDGGSILTPPVVQPGSFNVASVDRPGVGLYFVNFETPMTTTTYTALLSTNGNGVSVQCDGDVLHSAAGATTTGGFGVFVSCSSTGMDDPNLLTIAVFENS